MSTENGPLPLRCLSLSVECSVPPAHIHLTHGFQINLKYKAQFNIFRVIKRHFDVYTLHYFVKLERPYHSDMAVFVLILFSHIVLLRACFS